MPSEPRYMRNALTESIEYPLSYNLIHGTVSTGSIGNLQASDDVYFVFDSVLVGSQQQVEVEFIGDHSGHMPFLQELVELHPSVAANLVLQAYNYSTGAYETAGSMYLPVGLLTTDATFYLYSILNNRNYRSNTGEWKVKILVYTIGAPAPSFSLYIDYLYFRTVAHQLGTSQTLTSAGNDTDVCGLTCGIRIWKVNSDDSETEIGVPGTLKATVTGACSTTTLSNTYTPPSTTDVVAIVVRVYRSTDIMERSDLHAGGLPCVFITEDLNSTLSEVQWTVYYAFHYIALFDETYYTFGTTTYNSRIANFTWGVAVAAPSGDGLTWVFA